MLEQFSKPPEFGQREREKEERKRESTGHTKEPYGYEFLFYR